MRFLQQEPVHNTRGSRHKVAGRVTGPDGYIWQRFFTELKSLVSKQEKQLRQHANLLLECQSQVGYSLLLALAMLFSLVKSKS